VLNVYHRRGIYDPGLTVASTQADRKHVCARITTHSPEDVRQLVKMLGRTGGVGGVWTV